jgi:hypothetical protein
MSPRSRCLLLPKLLPDLRNRPIPLLPPPQFRPSIQRRGRSENPRVPQCRARQVFRFLASCARADSAGEAAGEGEALRAFAGAARAADACLRDAGPDCLHCSPHGSGGNGVVFVGLTIHCVRMGSGWAGTLIFRGGSDAGSSPEISRAKRCLETCSWWILKLYRHIDILENVCGSTVLIGFQCQLEESEESITRLLCSRTATRAIILRSILPRYVIYRLAGRLTADKPFVERSNNNCSSDGCLMIWNRSFRTICKRRIHRIDCCLKTYGYL